MATIPFEVATLEYNVYWYLRFYPTLGFIVSSFSGEFSVFMDHFIKIPPTKTKSQSRSKIPDQEKLFHNVLRRRLEVKNGSPSITCLTYSDKQKLLLFGSLNGKVTFFNLLCNEVSSLQQATSA
jgi:hypothetical protein